MTGSDLWASCRLSAVEAKGGGGGDKRRAGRKFDVLPGPEPDWNHEMEINNVSAAKNTQ